MWREQYERMLRGLAKVEDHYRGTVEYEDFGPEHTMEFRDAVVHAFQDVFALRDWLKADPNVTVPDNEINRLFSGAPDEFPNLHLARDLANASKHLVLDRTASISEDANVARDPDVDMVSAATMRRTHVPQSIRVQIDAGRSEDALAVLKDCVAEWKTFLSMKGLM
jgi:hypothetical protein